MDSAAPVGTRSDYSAVLPHEYLDPHWYAVYTCARHEKKVQEQLRQRAVESFLPLYETVRRWKDRCVRLEFPLFPSYVFVRIALRDRLGIQQIPSVVRFVGFNGTPTPLPENGIESLRKGLVKCVRAEPYPYLKIGRRVRIKSGPLQGMQGIVVRKKNVIRVVISLELIMRSIAVETDALDLEPLS